ncbi:MAG: glutamine amidotransferase [Clostridia bacterium]|nr:glutamine amidotransferase [Clostridia bacterium]
MQIRIVHLYPDLLNLYGDKGNISALEKRCIWRGIDVQITEIKTDGVLNLEECDILFLGGGGQHEQEIVLEKLSAQKDALKEYVDSGGVLLAVCGGFQMAGKLGLIDVRYKKAKQRASGNVIIECDFGSGKVLVSGFENHEYTTDIGDLKPLGDVLEGFGNNGMGFEGAMYKNVVASNLHGPLLPKNPELCDFIIKKALERKYGGDVSLASLSDNFENIASKNIIKAVLGENK